MINLQYVFNTPESEVAAAIRIIEARLDKRLEILKHIERTHDRCRSHYLL